MDPKKIIIAGSIGAVVVGLLVVGLLIYRTRALSGPAAAPTQTPGQSSTTTASTGGGLTPGKTPLPGGSGTASGNGGSASGAPNLLTATNSAPVAPPDFTGGKDTDGDGLPDAVETGFYHTDPNKADTDGDGTSDYDEVRKYGSDPLDPKSNPKTIPGHAKFGL